MAVDSKQELKACPICGQVQTVPTLAPWERARCTRCNGVVLCGARLADGNRSALAAALAALILYPLAINLPIMQLDRFGHSTEASVYSGSLGLLAEGEVFVGGLVFACSVVLPILKILGIIVLCTTQRLPSKHRVGVYHAIEKAGRWGMLDVLLVAVVVAWVKMGDLVEVTPGPGAVAFSACVVLSLIASASFDPHSLWKTSE